MNVQHQWCEAVQPIRCHDNTSSGHFTVATLPLFSFLLIRCFRQTLLEIPKHGHQIFIVLPATLLNHLQTIHQGFTGLCEIASSIVREGQQVPSVRDVILLTQ